MRCPNCTQPDMTCRLRRLDELLAEGLVLREDVLPDGDRAAEDRYFIFCAPDKTDENGRQTTDFGRTAPNGIYVLKPARGEGCWISTLCPVCLGSRRVNEPDHPDWPRRSAAKYGE